MQVKNKGGFYSLIHSYRDAGVKNFEWYIGKQTPTAADKEKFIHDYVHFRWGAELASLQKIYADHLKDLSVPLSRKNLRAFGVRFTHNTNKIEGSTLSLGDTRMILTHGNIPADSNLNDVIETKAHMQVYEKLVGSAEELNLSLLLKWHGEIFTMTKPGHAGEVRNGPVMIAGSSYVPPPSRMEIDLLLEELFRWYTSKSKDYSPVFRAAVMHYRFVSIHPFEDGNGRITRLLMNKILHLNGFPMFDLDPKYRQGYYNALERSNSDDNSMAFVNWFCPRYLSNTKKMMKSLGILD